jgi:alcohol dehydrogenase (nicotinoprotein)
VQGARFAGAKNLIAVDPLQNKREKAMELGASHAVATIEEAGDLARSMTNGNGADKAVVTAGIVTEEIVTGAFNAIGKGGTVVLTGLNKLSTQNVNLPGSLMTLFKKTVKGSLFGDCNPTTDIPKILGLYQSGDIKLDELITKTYTLEQVNEGYDDLLNGKNVRGVLIHQH